MRIALTVIISLLAFCSSAHCAPNAEDQKICTDRNADPDRKISSCSVMLQTATDKSTLIISWHQRGISYFRKGQYDKAIADYSEAIVLKPDFVFAWGARGLAYQAKGDMNAALQNFNRAVEIEPGADQHLARGHLLEAGKEWSKAKLDFEEVIRISPNRPDGYTGRGNCYNATGDDARALADYDQAIKIDPVFWNALSSRARFYMDRKQNDKALDDFDRLIQIDPKFAASHAAKALLYKNNGDMVRSKAESEEAARLGWK